MPVATKKSASKKPASKSRTAASPASKKAPAKPLVAAKTSPKAPLDFQIGSKVPEFSLPATDIGRVSLSTLKGKPFVLYFYPKDDTSGCTVEACDFRDVAPQFNQLGLTVVGVSRDSLASHEKFKKKYNLNFPLASDEDGKVCEAFGVWVEKSMYGRKYMGIERTTFLVDAKGVIHAMWKKVSVVGHVAEVAKAAKSL